MKNFSKVALTSIAALTVASPLVNMDTNAKEKVSATQDIDAKVTQQTQAPTSLKELPNSQNVKNLYKDYAVTDTKKDSKGFTHYTLQPKVGNTFAPDKEVKVHTNKDGKVVLINGDTDAKKVKPTNKVSLSKDDAANKAFEAVNLNRDKAKNIKSDVIKQNKVEIDGEKNKYVYNVEIITTSPKITHWNVKIDAQSGKVVDKLNMLNEAATTGTGKGVLGDTKQININSINGGYALQDLTHQDQLSAYDYNDSTGQAYLMQDNDNNFVDDDQRAGVDANYYAKETYDYYKNTFGRESYDDHGSPIISLAHVNNFHGQSNRNNAAWIGDEMIYGDGDALRSMSNPEQFGQPSHMDDYVYTNSDNGGVHTNSGIPNKAAYNTIRTVGKQCSEQIYYRALTEYLTSNVDFKDAKVALQQVAQDLYGDGVAQQVGQA
ncbi:M4 family metallopeptidase [Staphylococcus saccharolyticus]|uniref:M4 family metallopeptidase n=1 Tax=Staphylococcus saccharolyticus TaxID=33028 RepID=UPI0032DF1392